jgi:hypothetical protein
MVQSFPWEHVCLQIHYSAMLLYICLSRGHCPATGLHTIIYCSADCRLDLHSWKPQFQHATLHWTTGKVCASLSILYHTFNAVTLSTVSQSVSHNHSLVLACHSSKHSTTHRPQSHFPQQYLLCSVFSLGTHNNYAFSFSQPMQRIF